jgi:hypothetical protein
MADERPQAPDSPGSSPTTVPLPGPVHIGAELGELEEKESRFRILMVTGVALAVIAAIVAVISFATRPRPQAKGSIDEVYAVALPGDSLLVTVKVTFNNIGQKPVWIRGIKAQLTGADGQQYSDEAANAVDFPRYFQGYPDLRNHSLPALKVETRLAPGEQVQGSVIVGFPVTPDAFGHRKALSVTIYLYASSMGPTGGDQPPVVIKENL